MCTCKKVFLKIVENSQENICAGVCFLIRKKSTAKVFLLEFCEFFKSNTACIEHVQSSSCRPILLIAAKTTSGKMAQAEM